MLWNTKYIFTSEEDKELNLTSIFISFPYFVIVYICIDRTLSFLEEFSNNVWFIYNILNDIFNYFYFVYNYKYLYFENF